MPLRRFPRIIYPYGAGCVVSGKAEPKAHTIGYATEATTQQLAKQTSKTGKFFAGNRLNTVYRT